MIESICLQEIAKYGVDNVVLLPPCHQKTETGVNALNQRIQGKVNPPDPARNEAVYLGYMSGSFQGFVTDGVAMYNSQKSCYVIATSVGVRLQAGDLELYLTTEDDFVKVNGDLRVDGNVIYSGELMKSS